MTERVHTTAARGFDSAAEVYERARPGYPPEAVAHVVRELGLHPGVVVVDVAAGTGKFTAELLARGLSCIAVEPVAGMRETFARVLPGAQILDGTAEGLPFDDSSVDALTVAQAFHWFRHAEALAEFRRVLKPGGGVALLWNVRDDRVPWVARLTEIIDPYADGSSVGIPRYRDRSWEPAVDALPALQSLGSAAFDHGHPTTPTSLVERVESTSFIATLAEEERAKVAEQVLAVVDEFGLGDAFDYPYVCEVHLYRSEG